VSAILWRHQNGAKWRAVPDKFGPWWRAAQVFFRWARLGVWERLLDLVQARDVWLGLVFLDGTSVRAHQKAAGAARRGDLKLRERIVKHLADLVAGMKPKLAGSPTGRGVPWRSGLHRGRRMSCLTPSRSSTGCRACPSGLWATVVTAATEGFRLA